MTKLLSILLLLQSCLTASAASAAFPAIRLGATTNLISDNGSSLTRNGFPLGNDGVGFSYLAYITNSTAYTVTNIYATNVGVGTLDLWTVPDGYFAAPCGGFITCTTNTAGSATALAVKRSGSYYMLSGALSVTTNTLTGFTAQTFIYSPGDVVAFTNSVAGVYIYASMRLWSTNFSGPRTIAEMNLSSGATNLLYQVPASKTAGSGNGPLLLSSQCFIGIKTPITSLRHQLWIVPSGRTLGSEYLILDRTSPNASLSVFSVGELSAGDAIYACTYATNASQSFWVTVGEYSTP